MYSVQVRLGISYQLVFYRHEEERQNYWTWVLYRAGTKTPIIQDGLHRVTLAIACDQAWSYFWGIVYGNKFFGEEEKSQRVEHRMVKRLGFQFDKIWKGEMGIIPLPAGVLVIDQDYPEPLPGME